MGLSSKDKAAVKKAAEAGGLKNVSVSSSGKVSSSNGASSSGSSSSGNTIKPLQIDSNLSAADQAAVAKAYVAGGGSSKNITYSNGKVGTEDVEADIKANVVDNRTANEKAGISQADIDKDLAGILSDASLTDDQKELIKQIYGTVANNDLTKASQMTTAFKTALQASDPYFRNLIRVAQDSLLIGLQSEKDTLAFSEQQKSNTLADLKADIERHKGSLTLDQARDLKTLARNYEVELGDTRDTLASLGFSESSRRANKESLMAETNSDLVESTNRSFGQQQTELTLQGQREDRDTALEIEALRKAAALAQTKLLHNTEANIGSNNVAGIGSNSLLDGVGALGNLPGEIEHDRNKDALSFANSFVF